MAKSKLVWSHRARIKLFDILRFYSERNKSRKYSEKLYQTINRELRLLVKQPDLGIKTEIDAVRGLIIGDYIVFYEVAKDKIIIHNIWDSRKNPDELIIK